MKKILLLIAFLWGYGLLNSQAEKILIDTTEYYALNKEDFSRVTDAIERLPTLEMVAIKYNQLLEDYTIYAEKSDAVITSQEKIIDLYSKGLDLSNVNNKDYKIITSDYWNKLQVVEASYKKQKWATIIAGTAGTGVGIIIGVIVAKLKN